MTPEQVTLVQQTFEKVVPIADTAADLFYQHLFETHPEVRSLFPDEMAEQKKKLMASITMVARGLDKPDTIVPAIQEMGRRHIDYGVSKDMYPIVGGNLLWTLEQGLGEAFTPEVKAAWTAAYELLANIMCEAAYGAE